MASVSREDIAVRAIQVALLVGGLWVWQYLASHGKLNTFVTGEPAKVWETLRAWLTRGVLIDNALITLRNTVVALAMSILLGTAIGIFLGTHPRTRSIVEPYIAFMNAAPRIVFYPFFALWLGYDYLAKVTFITFVVIFVVIVNVVAGMDAVDERLIVRTRLAGGRWWHLLRDVHLPSVLVWVGTSARLLLGFAFQAAIFSEFLGSAQGLGYLVVSGQGRFDVNIVWAALTATVALAVLLDLALTRGERRLRRYLPR